MSYPRNTRREISHDYLVPNLFQQSLLGPRSFKKGEKLYGRDYEIAELLDLLIAERIVLLYSPSGAGKTSLIQAALIPELEKKKFLRVLPVMRVVEPPPSDLELPVTFNRYIFSLLLHLEEPLSAGDRIPLTELVNMELVDYLVQRAEREATTDKKTVEVLIFDQFEEILTSDPTDLEIKEVFFAQLGEALNNKERWSLFAIAEEYWGGLEPYSRLIPTRFDTTFRLALLNEAAAFQAIQEPARRTGIEFEDVAVRQLVDDLRKIRVLGSKGIPEDRLGPYVEPVQLQVVCQRIWENPRLNESKISVGDVQRFGDVNKALAAFYEDAVHAAAITAGISEGQIREWCEQKLITPLRTRGMVLQEYDNIGDLPKAAVQVLERQHLIRSEEWAGARWYELTHDRFIMPIQESNRPVELKPIQETLSATALNEWIRNMSDHLSRQRRRQSQRTLPLSSKYEEFVDWHNAELLFACQVLDGNINFAFQNSPQLYSLLEKIWLTEVKQFKAYFIWEDRRNDWKPGHDEENYYEACKQIRRMLVDKPTIKAHRKTFAEARAYLETRYLTDGKIDKSKSDASNMIRLKANRITGKADSEKNEQRAEAYAKMFYENIIPAVIEDNPENVLLALKAFQFSKAPENRFLIINCFEVALAIYFLKSEIILDLWEKSKLISEPPTISTLTVQSWPRDFTEDLEGRFRYDRDNRQVTFDGVMTQLQKDALLTKLTGDEDKKVIETLFEQSRWLPQETTL